jgi:hypothetical protein
MTTFSVTRLAKIYPNWDFLFKNIPSGNPGTQDPTWNHFYTKGFFAAFVSYGKNGGKKVK